MTSNPVDRSINFGGSVGIWEDRKIMCFIPAWGYIPAADWLLSNGPVPQPVTFKIHTNIRRCFQPIIGTWQPQGLDIWMFTVPYAIFFVYCKPAFVVDVLSWFMIFHSKPPSYPQKYVGARPEWPSRVPRRCPRHGAVKQLPPIGLRWFISRMNTMVNKC